MSTLPNWFVNGLLALILVAFFLLLFWIATRVFETELHGLVSLLKSEIKDSREGRITVGSINWKGFLVVGIIGFVSTVAMSSQKFLGVMIEIFGSEKSHEFLKSTNYFTLLFFCGGFLFLSLVCVMIDNANRRNKR